ncbi:hypothetical protein HNQ96_002579 [Aminobacter lissarensis]|uniref:Uncharacterized protein n=1 Tax=Aminobacter carboxidus TaxID=376165 RepID=A0A8E1WFM5_9HYPH|nr:hypothetical protein [Aminobacter lissarensis]
MVCAKLSNHLQFNCKSTRDKRFVRPLNRN